MDFRRRQEAIIMNNLTNVLVQHMIVHYVYEVVSKIISSIQSVCNRKRNTFPQVHINISALNETVHPMICHNLKSPLPSFIETRILHHKNKRFRLRTNSLLLIIGGKLYTRRVIFAEEFSQVEYVVLVKVLTEKKNTKWSQWLVRGRVVLSKRMSINVMLTYHHPQNLQQPS